MSSDETYFNLSVFYELSRSVNNMQIVTNAFMIIPLGI